MKLIIVIIEDDDAHKLINNITNAGFRITKLSTTGGFLKSGNTTLMIGVREKDVDQILKIINKTCKSRKQITAKASTVASSMGVYVPLPVNVDVGGATIFVVDVDKFVRI